MLFSGALLCAFLGFWLRTEWQGEKRALQTELQDKFNLAGRQVKDSLFRFKIVRPFMQRRHDSPKPLRLMVSDPKASRLPPDARLHPTLTIRNTIIQTKGSAPRRLRDTAVMNIVEGINVFLNEAFPDSLSWMLEHGDTMRIRRKMEATFDSVQAHFNLLWQNIPQPDSYAVILLRNAEWQQLPPLAVSNYKPYLMRRMLPQILFALALAGIIMLAFMLAWRSLQRERRLFQMKNSLVSNMSHELKTPVTTVKVALEALGEEAVLENRATVREYVDIAAQELQRLELLINGTLHNSLMESGRLPMQFAPADLRALTESLVGSLRLRLQKSGAQVSLSFTGDDFTIKADKLHIQGVLLNIIDNALKYGGDGVRICIDGVATSDAVWLSISDDGPGIPAAYTKRVFERFFRVPTGNLHLVKGYGLGLSYAAEVARLHGGSITVSSDEGKGGTFTLQLPKHRTA